MCFCYRHYFFAILVLSVPQKTTILPNQTYFYQSVKFIPSWGLVWRRFRRCSFYPNLYHLTSELNLHNYPAVWAFVVVLSEGSRLSLILIFIAVLLVGVDFITLNLQIFQHPCLFDYAWKIRQISTAVLLKLNIHLDFHFLTFLECHTDMWRVLQKQASIYFMEFV